MIKKNLYLIFFASTFSSLLYAAVPPSFLFGTSAYQPILELHLKQGKQRLLGRAGAVMPLQASNQGLWFMQIWGLWDSEAAKEWNVGLGYRHWLGDWVVGAYGFFDRRISTLGGAHAQITFGAELLGENFETRMNGYIPTTKAKPVNPVINKVSSPSLFLTDKLEKVLGGFDIEIGGSLPSYKALHGFLSYYYFNGSHVNVVHGMRLKGELNLTSYMALIGEVSHDRLRKSNWFIGMNFKLSLAAAKKEVNLSKKMTQMIIRDIDVIVDSIYKNDLLDNGQLMMADKPITHAAYNQYLVKENCKFIEVKQFIASSTIRDKIQSIIVYSPVDIELKLRAVNSQSLIGSYIKVPPYDIQGMKSCKKFQHLLNFVTHSYWRIYAVGEDYGVKAYAKGLGGGKNKKISLRNTMTDSTQAQTFRQPLQDCHNGIQFEPTLSIGGDSYTVSPPIAASCTKHSKEKQKKIINHPAPSSTLHQFKVLGIRPKANTPFVARKNKEGKDILEGLKAKLQRSKAKVTVQVIVGRSSIGKTALAAEYIRQTTPIYDGIFWVQAGLESPYDPVYTEALAIDLKEISPDLVAYTIHENLMHRSYKKILWVYDDVPNAQLFCTKWFTHKIKEMWKKSNTMVQVLATSRSLHWPHRVPIQLELFSEFNIITYLNFFFKNGLYAFPRSSMAEVVEFKFLLGGLPLAIAQAIDYIKNKQDSTGIRGYIDIYKTHYKRQLGLKYFSEELNNYHKILWTVWDVTREHLSKEAHLLLHISCFLSGHNISPLLFTPLWGKQVYEIIKELANYSLIKFNNDVESFNMPKSLQKILQLQQANASLILSQTADLAIKACETFKKEDPNTWMAVKCWLPQVVSLLEKIEDIALKEKIFFSYRPLAEVVGNHFVAENNLLKSLMLQPTAYRLNEVKEEITDLSAIAFELGQGEMARDCLWQALMLQTDHDDSDHIKIASILHHLGCVEAELGQAELARSCLLKALARRIHYYDEGHISVILTLIRLAELELKLNYADAARDYLLRALTLQDRYYRENFREQITILEMLGTIECELGHWEGAKDYLLRALVVQTHYYEENQMAMILTLRNLGCLELKLGQDAIAKDYLLQALALQTCYYEGVYIILTSILVNLGHIELKLGYYEKAKDYLEQALDIQKSMDGENYREMIHILLNLANAEIALGDGANAKTYLLRALNLQVRHYGHEHIKIASLLNNLGNIEAHLGHHKMAKNYLERALARQVDYYGNEHIELAGLFNNLGTAQVDLGDYEAAKNYYNQALGLQIRYYGQEHIELASTLINLGAVEADLGDYESAKHYLLRALALQTHHYEEGHIAQIVTLNNLIHVEQKLGHDENASHYLQYVSALKRRYFPY